MPIRFRLALVPALTPAVALVAGLPFLLAWILGWVLVTPAFLGLAYLLDRSTSAAEDGDGR